MFLRRLKHTLLRLSAEEKVIGIGGLVTILGVFMPWYSVVLSFEKGITESGFSGDLGVIGFVVFLMTLLALGFLLGDHFRFRLPRFGFKKESIILFFSGESAFLLLLVAAVFTKRSLDYTNAEIRFGLYMALLGSLFATFAAFAQLQKLQKKENKAFFEHEEAIEETVTEPQPEETIPEEVPSAKPHHAKRHHAPKAEERQVVQEKFFEEEKAYEAAEEVFEPAQAETSVEEVVAEEVTRPMEEGPSGQNQGNYFLRDADLGAATEPEVAEKKEEESPRPANRDMGFYNDL
jgi:hypothetical protein